MPSGSRYALTALLVAATFGAVLTVGIVGAAAGAAAPADGTASGGATAVDGGATTAASPATAPAGAQGQVGSDGLFRSNSTIEIQLQSNGNARFQVTIYRRNLTTAAQREEFRSVATAFENGQTNAARTVNAFTRASSEASKVTGRQMRIEAVDQSATIVPRSDGNETGELVLSFTWTNFAAAEDGRLEVDEVFETRNGLWLSRLEAGQTLVITPPDGYEPVNVNGNYQTPSWHWNGPQSFSTESHPVAVFDENPPSLLFVGLAAGGIAVLLVVVYLLVRYRDVFTDRGSGEAPAASAEADDPADGETPAPETTANGQPTNGAGDDEIDVELLSDEERVERLLEQNGGRMKQASIVKETGWSNAKVSQLLSSMEEADRVDKLRIGRENLISFPDEDVADVEE